MSLYIMIMNIVNNLFEFFTFNVRSTDVKRLFKHNRFFATFSAHYLKNIAKKPPHLPSEIIAII